jgi:adenine-specific DNA-methyltransferase
MDLLTRVTTTLKKDKRLTSKDGALLKSKIIELTLKLDRELVNLLMQEEELKTHFFAEFNNVLVFDQNRFIKFVDNKNFLLDSYTTYKNRIGLTIKDNYLEENKEVVLSFPFKDCVLEGGMEKEDVKKRDEVFLNEILAPDEIDRLKEPKVFTNFKRINAKGEQAAKELKPTDNLIIRGNNFLALCSLRKKLAGKVKLIYIDPPYNTKDDSFRYNDSFNHSTWLTFVRNRLQIAKELLHNDGAIIVQCDDNEAAYLKVLMDELFHRENCLVTLYFQVRYAKKTLAEDNDFQKVIEQAFVYVKNIETFKPIKDLEEYSIEKFEWKIIEKKTGEKIKLGGKEAEIFKPGQYEIENIKPSLKGLKETWATGSLVRQKGSSGEFLANFISPRKNLDGLSCLYKVYGIGEDGLGYRYFTGPKREDATKGKFYSGIPLPRVAELKLGAAKKEVPIANFHDFSGDFGNCRLEGDVDIRGGKKPEKLVQFLLKHFSSEKDIVLDFHLGSGTTCAVAHKMNRQYIGIEQLDYGENDCVIRLKNVIGTEKSKGKLGRVIEDYDESGISEEVNWKGGGECVFCELKKWNEKYVDAVTNAKTSDDLKNIWEKMKTAAFLSYKVKVEEFDNTAKEFEELTFDNRKRFLIECLDKNHLYVNLSEIDDKDYDISPNDKELNRKFYSVL